MDHADLNSPITLIQPLTRCEEYILRLMARDISTVVMVNELYLSPATATWYTRQIDGKLSIPEPGHKRRQIVSRTLDSNAVVARFCRRVHELIFRLLNHSRGETVQ